MSSTDLLMAIEPPRIQPPFDLAGLAQRFRDVFRPEIGAERVLGRPGDVHLRIVGLPAWLVEGCEVEYTFEIENRGALPLHAPLLVETRVMGRPPGDIRIETLEPGILEPGGGLEVSRRGLFSAGELALQATVLATDFRGHVLFQSQQEARLVLASSAAVKRWCKKSPEEPQNLVG